MHPKSHSNHAKAIIPGLREAVDSKGQRYKYHAGHRALVGPDTIIVLHGRPPLRAHQHMAQGGLPPEVTGHAANRHPGAVAHELAQMADKELPRHKSKARLPLGANMPPPAGMDGGGPPTPTGMLPPMGG